MRKVVTRWLWFLLLILQLILYVMSYPTLSRGPGGPVNIIIIDVIATIFYCHILFILELNPRHPAIVWAYTIIVAVWLVFIYEVVKLNFMSLIHHH